MNRYPVQDQAHLFFPFETQAQPRRSFSSRWRSVAALRELDTKTSSWTNSGTMEGFPPPSSSRMGEKTVRRSGSKHNIPMEIWWEILVWLPVRSLVRFRCVSRSWKTVIDDPDFCREHLVRFKNNCDETHLLMVQDERQCFVRYSDTMKTSRRLGSLGTWDKKPGVYKNTATPGFKGIWRICFSVDGLVMLKCYLRRRLMLWNPSIRRCRLVPYSENHWFLELGLGFDPLIRDYKIVRVGHKTPSSVEIYTVGAASWKTVAAQGAVPSSWPQAASALQSVYFKGCLYILSCGKQLISFDLSKEAFKSLDLPEYKNSAPTYIGGSLALVDGGSSLALYHFSSNIGSVWLLDDNADVSTWIMRCTLSMSGLRVLYLKKNDDLLFDRVDIDARLDVVSYNLHTGEERLTNCPKTTSRIFDYKESLVLLK